MKNCTTLTLATQIVVEQEPRSVEDRISDALDTVGIHDPADRDRYTQILLAQDQSIEAAWRRICSEYYAHLNVAWADGILSANLPQE